MLVHGDQSSPMIDFLHSSSVLQARAGQPPSTACVLWRQGPGRMQGDGAGHGRERPVWTACAGVEEAGYSGHLRCPSRCSDQLCIPCGGGPRSLFLSSVLQVRCDCPPLLLRNFLSSEEGSEASEAAASNQKDKACALLASNPSMPATAASHTCLCRC